MFCPLRPHQIDRQLPPKNLRSLYWSLPAPFPLLTLIPSLLPFIRQPPPFPVFYFLEYALPIGPPFALLSIHSAMSFPQNCRSLRPPYSSFLVRSPYARRRSRFSHLSFADNQGEVGGRRSLFLFHLPEIDCSAILDPYLPFFEEAKLKPPMSTWGTLL